MKYCYSNQFLIQFTYDIVIQIFISTSHSISIEFINTYKKKKFNNSLLFYSTNKIKYLTRFVIETKDHKKKPPNPIIFSLKLGHDRPSCKHDDWFQYREALVSKKIILPP